MTEPRKKFAKMTDWELQAWVSSHESGWNHIALAALRHAIRAEAYVEASDEYTRRLVEAQGRAERAEADLSRSRDAHNAAIRERDALKANQGVDPEYKAAYLRAYQRAVTAESALREARREGAREALTRLVERLQSVDYPMYAINVEYFRDREYPATPSGEPKSPESPDGCLRCGDICKPWCHNAPQPEALVIPVELMSINGKREWGVSEHYRITITPALARRLVAMGQEGRTNG